MVAKRVADLLCMRRVGYDGIQAVQKPGRECGAIHIKFASFAIRSFAELECNRNRIGIGPNHGQLGAFTALFASASAARPRDLSLAFSAVNSVVLSRCHDATTLARS